MLNMRQIAQAIVIAIFVVWVSLASWHRWGSSVPPNYDQPENQSTERGGQSTLQVPPTERIDDRLARYTFWLAIFTAALVITSAVQNFFLLRADKTARIAAEAAGLNAKAALGTELPKVVPKSITLQMLGVGNLAAQIQFPKVAVEFENFGRTAAFIARQAAEILIAEHLPEKPLYPNAHDLEPGAVIEAGRQWSSLAKGREIPIETINLIIDGKTRLWVYGYIFYRDFLNEPHMTRFCAELYVPTVPAAFQGASARFIQSGPDSYTECY